MRIFNLFPITPRDLTCIPVRGRLRRSYKWQVASGKWRVPSSRFPVASALEGGYAAGLPV